MAIFITFFSLAALLYVAFLPFLGKRARKQKKSSQPAFEFELSDVKAKRYDDFIHYMDRQGNERG